MNPVGGGAKRVSPFQVKAENASIFGDVNVSPECVCFVNV